MGETGYLAKVVVVRFITAEMAVGLWPEGL